MRTRSRLSLGAKILLVVVSFTALPIAVLLYFAVTTINDDIRFSSLELEGNELQRPLEALLDDAGQYALLGRYASADPQVRQQLDEAAAGIAKSFAALADADRRFGHDLQFTTEGLSKRGRQDLTVQIVQGQWREIIATPISPSAPVDAKVERDGKFDRFFAALRGMITHAGDTSNLILDPDLDSYYLMDVTLLALPQTQDRLTRTIRFGGDRLATSALTAEDRLKLAVDAALLEESDMSRVVASTQAALIEDSNFYGISPTLTATLNPAIAEYRAANGQFIALLRKIATEPRSTVDLNEFLAAGMKARQASFQLWDVTVLELDRLLATRIASHRNRLTITLVGSLVAFLIAAGMAYGLNRSITKPLDKIAETLGPGADLLANCVNKIAESPEESDIICEELGAHIGYMRQSVRELTLIVKGGRLPETSTPTPQPRKRELATAGRE